MIAVVVALLGAVGLVGGLWWVRSADRLIRARERRQVVVELRSGETFRGLLDSADARTVVLRNVTALTGEQTAPLAVDGELLIPRGDIKYLQRP